MSPEDVLSRHRRIAIGLPWLLPLTLICLFGFAGPYLGRAGAQGHDPDDPSFVSASLTPPRTESSTGTSPVDKAQTIDNSVVTKTDTSGEERADQTAPPPQLPPPSLGSAASDIPVAPVAPPSPQIDPLLSCGVFVDGLVYDLPMPWGQPEFEKLRESYLSPGGKKWLAVVMARALPYLAYVENKVEELGLPKELVYLPVIESEYSPLAVSSSGATGIWQFMRNSIKGYGLSISDWVDDRKDFMKSTDAALSKLKDNEGALGDWLLALAAYNAGLGAVSRAVKSSDDKSLDFWQLYESRKLSREPLSYVPKFLAAASILRYPELHGLPAEWGEKSAWEAVETKRQVDMNVLAEKTGIPLDLLKAGNAELRYHVTPPAAVHTLKVPADKAEVVRSILADESTPLYRYELYKVKSGDTLGAIAQRYGTSLPLILQSNPGVKADKIKIGQTIIIPKLPGKSSATTASVQRTTAVASSYVVKRGDTLWSIAVALGLRLEELLQANNIAADDVLRIGQVLKLPAS